MCFTGRNHVLCNDRTYVTEAIPNLIEQLPDLPLCPVAHPQVAHLNQCPCVGRHIQLGAAGIGKNRSVILRRNTGIHHVRIVSSRFFHIVRELRCAVASIRERVHIPEVVLPAVPLRTDRKADVPMPGKLRQTGTADSFDVEGEAHMLQHRHMPGSDALLHNAAVLCGLAVIANRSRQLGKSQGVTSAIRQLAISDQFNFHLVPPIKNTHRFLSRCQSSNFSMSLSITAL